MSQVNKNSAPAFPQAVATFALTLIFCCGCCLFLTSLMPEQKRPFDYLAEGIFCALLAVPSGAAWRSLRRARSGRWPL